MDRDSILDTLLQEALGRRGIDPQTIKNYPRLEIIQALEPFFNNFETFENLQNFVDFIRYEIVITKNSDPELEGLELENILYRDDHITAFSY